MSSNNNKKFYHTTGLFIGKDKSCGFRTGESYTLKIRRTNYIWVFGRWGKRCPYSNLTKLFENWQFTPRVKLTLIILFGEEH